jgi:hypothetical protein
MNPITKLQIIVRTLTEDTKTKLTLISILSRNLTIKQIDEIYNSTHVTDNEFINIIKRNYETGL